MTQTSDIVETSLSCTDSLSVVGKSVTRIDALAKVKGEAIFVPDMQLPGMLYARFLRSPHAHARILRIDTGKAEALPGVRAVLTHLNVPRVHPRRKLEYLLCEEMHCAGDEVAAVAADTKEIAEEALKLIDVEYEVLPAVFDSEEAMKPGAPLVHPEVGNSNMHHGFPGCARDRWLHLDIGDIEKGFSEADFLVENTYETPKQYTCSPVTRAVICQWAGDKLTCWADTHVPQRPWHDLANCLGLPQSKIKVIVSSVGSYGAKEPEKTAVLTALLARRASRPVKAEFTRAEDFIGTHRRVDYKGYSKIGLKKDGTITGLYTRCIANYGNDSLVPMWVVATSGAKTFVMLYRTPNVKFEGCGVMTNTTHHSAVLGFGDPEAGLITERLADEAAEAIGMDPVAFRLKNCVRYGDPGYEREWLLMDKPPRRGIVGHDVDLQECLRQAAAAARWQEKWRGWKTPVAIDGSRRRGIGVAIGMHHCTYQDYSALVRMNHDGTANVQTSAAEIGQGCATVIVQVVAEALGLRYEDVNAYTGDSSAYPMGWGNTGSTGTSAAVSAAKRAADDARKKLLAIAAQGLGVNIEDLDIKDRVIFACSNPDKKMSVAEACIKGFQVIGFGLNPPRGTFRDPETGEELQHYAVAAVVAEVEVDADTGELNLLQIASANDCGRAINPANVDNQINLGIVFGNGMIRSEDYIIDPKTGVMLNPNLLDYKVMTILDMPKSEDTHRRVIELPSAWGAYGAKGFSETAVVAVAPAIVNAVYNAIGVRIRGDHLTPDRILAALGKI